MNPHRSPGLLAALGLLAGALGAFLPATADAAPQTGGRARGKIDLPDAVAGGVMHGYLKRRHGHHPAFELHAKLVASTLPGEGDIEGALLRPNQPVGTPPVALLKGRYKADPAGKGRFHIQILWLDPSGSQPPKKVGEIHGRFDDPLPNGTPGKFLARWKLD